MRMVDLRAEDDALVEQAARLLVDCFAEHWPSAWPDLASALETVREALGPGRIARAALDDDGALIGWIGAASGYDGHVWELHPLAVRPDRQGRGVGGALVADLEALVAERGGLTLYLGTDDEDHMTSLADVDLYPNVAEHLLHVENRRRHPFEFYRKQGFSIVGVIPDANGPGKPDILMAKRVGR